MLCDQLFVPAEPLNPLACDEELADWVFPFRIPKTLFNVMEKLGIGSRKRRKKLPCGITQLNMIESWAVGWNISIIVANMSAKVAKGYLCSILFLTNLIRNVV